MRADQSKSQGYISYRQNTRLALALWETTKHKSADASRYLPPTGNENITLIPSCYLREIRADRDRQSSISDHSARINRQQYQQDLTRLPL